MSCDENVVCIADVYLGFSYYCFKYFVFDVGHEEFRDGRTKRRPHRNTVNLYIYVAGGIIEWDFCGTCSWSTYIHKRPNIGNALRGLFTGVQSEKDGSNKTRALSHMGLGVIPTKHGVRRTNMTIIWVSTTLFKTSKDDVNQPTPKFWLDSKKFA